MIPYGRQSIDDDDIRAVLGVLRSDFLTTGPKVQEFEKAFADFVGTKYAVAVSSGTAALHAAMYAIGVGPRDEVIVPTMTFAATANCVLYQGATPIFVDVDSDTLLLDLKQVAVGIAPRIKAVIAVDYAGQACNYDALSALCHSHGLKLVADACHSLGGRYRGRSVGSLADLNVFSFYPVKPITTGEGGMVTTNDQELADRMRRFRNHGIGKDFRQREKEGSWHYEMLDLGYNYRITDIQCALGLSQLRKLPNWVSRRQQIAHCYSDAFGELEALEPLGVRKGISHAYHLYVVRLRLNRLAAGRDRVFAALREEGIGANVHYIPIHLHPYYQNRFGTRWGMYPVSEAAYEEILSLPIFPGMSDQEVEIVISAVRRVMDAQTTR